MMVSGCFDCALLIKVEEMTFLNHFGQETGRHLRFWHVDRKPTVDKRSLRASPVKVCLSTNAGVYHR